MQLPQNFHDCKTCQRILNDRDWSEWDSHTENTKYLNRWRYRVHPAPWLQDCSLQHPLCFSTGTRNQSRLKHEIQQDHKDGGTVNSTFESSSLNGCIKHFEILVRINKN